MDAALLQNMEVINVLVKTIEHYNPFDFHEIKVFILFMVCVLSPTDVSCIYFI